MQSSEPQPRREVLREIVLAQLDAVKQYGTTRRLPLEEQMQELQQIQTRLQHKNASASASRYASASLHRSNVLSSGSVLQGGPSTRRLPPIFAEQRKNAAEIRALCEKLNKSLVELEEETFCGGKREHARRSTFLGKATMQLLQRRARRKAIMKMQNTLNEQQQQKQQKEDAEELEFDSTEANVDMEHEWIDEVRRARVAAADEGLSNEQSVSDYAEEPVVPHFLPDCHLQEEVETMDESLRKVNECVAAITTVDEYDTGNQWWDSAMRTREIKMAGIRLNYHARRILRWNQRAREHFLLEAVTSNEQMERCRADLTYLREQQNLFQMRIESCHKAQTDAATEAVTLQEALSKANCVKSELQQKLLAKAHEKRLLPRDCEDALLAELLLLLDYIAWPAVLQQDVDRVKTWISENAIPLDV